MTWRDAENFSNCRVAKRAVKGLMNSDSMLQHLSAAVLHLGSCYDDAERKALMYTLEIATTPCSDTFFGRESQPLSWAWRKQD
jgi:hypothetical protein